jgi:hypothetical protein
MLAALDILALAVMVGLFLLFLTQMALPFIFGTPFFPLFRKPTPLKKEVDKAEHEIEEQTELVSLMKQLEILNRRKAELEKKE